MKRKNHQYSDRRARPSIETQAIRAELGSALAAPGGTLTVDAAGSDVTVQVAPKYIHQPASGKTRG